MTDRTRYLVCRFDTDGEVEWDLNLRIDDEGRETWAPKRARMFKRRADALNYAYKIQGSVINVTVNVDRTASAWWETIYVP